MTKSLASASLLISSDKATQQRLRAATLHDHTASRSALEPLLLHIAAAAKKRLQKILILEAAKLVAAWSTGNKAERRRTSGAASRGSPRLCTSPSQQPHGYARTPKGVTTRLASDDRQRGLGGRRRCCSGEGAPPLLLLLLLLFFSLFSPLLSPPARAPLEFST